MVEGAERRGDERMLARRAAPPKLYKIGELMAHTGISRQTLHNYTMLGLITEEGRTESGHRLYGETVFDRLARITELKKKHSLREVQEILEAEARG
jgi:DNA-binding transcriptional MerR regulator